MGGDGDGSDEIYEISLHVIVGSLSPRTMTMCGQAQGCSVVILVDTRSSHNFLDPMVTKKAGLQIKKEDHIDVRVANGEKNEN